MDSTKYENFEKFVLRSPLFPLNKIQQVFSKSITTDEELKEMCRDARVEEAIFLASPALHSQMVKWLNNELTKPKDIERLKESVSKYLLRMGSRCTPFGLFAGYTLGEISDETRLELSSDQSYYGHLRLDMNYLCALAFDLSKLPEIKNQIKYYPNTSIYKSGDSLRYVEYKYINSKRNHFVVGVDDTIYLQKILSVSKGGLEIEALANSLVDDEISFEESLVFIDELIESQFLVSDLEPSVTGKEFLEQIIDVIKPLKGVEKIVSFLEEIEKIIQEIRNNPLGKPVGHYSKIIEKLSLFETKYDLKYLFQTDLVIKGKELEISTDIPKDILEGIEAMNKLTPAYSHENLKQFKEAFYERYEGREVSLLKALDIESGIGYLQNSGSGDLNPLVDDIVLPSKETHNESNIRWNRIQSFLFKKYNEYLHNGLKVVEISKDDLKEFESNWDDLPLSFNAMVEVVEPEIEGQKPLISFSSAGGSSAVNLLGRFCHSDKALNSYVEDITKKEKEALPEAIIAEIVHLPESRTGNILSRPQLREYEIPYLARPSVAKEYRLEVDDLMVSVPNGKRIVLRSRALNKEIIPRLSNAHNFSFNALPIYQFLCDLQTQDLRGGMGFNWGALENEYKFLPRVIYKNVILNKATWNFKKDDFKKVMDAKPESEKFQEIKKWIKLFKLPEYVLLVDGDNQLLLNLSNNLCINTLISLVKNRNAFQLKEFIFNTENCAVKRGKDSFTNQMVFSFFKTKAN